VPKKMRLGGKGIGEKKIGNTLNSIIYGGQRPVGIETDVCKAMGLAERSDRKQPKGRSVKKKRHQDAGRGDLQGPRNTRRWQRAEELLAVKVDQERGGGQDPREKGRKRFHKRGECGRRVKPAKESSSRSPTFSFMKRGTHHVKKGG